MAAKDKAGKAAKAAQTNPYIQRLIEDPQLRENLRAAFDSTRAAYGRLNNGKAPSKTLMGDKKLHRNLQDAASQLKDAGESLRSGPKKRKRRWGRKLMVLAVAGGLAAVALNEGLRSKVLDALFGAEEEFDYTSTTSPSPAPAPTPNTPTSA